ncbi:MAG: trehalose-6-phosphate synthase [Dehalococcoidia bacterium]|nr:trehalose-6-phosphate synthase [Dehalococcoidia bacterium]
MDTGPMALTADLILANRAYLDHDAPPGPGGAPVAVQGGLLAAVRPVIAPWVGGRGTTWIGAGRGPYDRDFVDAAGWEQLDTPRGPLRHRRLFFDDETWRGHYSQVANSFLWPLFHLVREPLPAITHYYPAPHEPDREEWDAFVRVNRAFAEAARQLPECRTCWVHDYQLALVPNALREAGYGGRAGFFLHTPFPDLEVASDFLDEHGRDRLAQVVRGILGADVVGFQGEPDVARFIAAAAELAGAEPVEGGARIDGRRVDIHAMPVGIDFDEVVAAAETGVVPADLRETIDPAMPLVVGLERADFTKGIPERLRAVAAAFEAGRQFTYVGVAAPTRQGVPAYRRLDAVIAREAEHCAAAAERAGGAFIQLRAAIPWDGVIALQREADVVFTSSLADGMNLVPLQAVAAQSLRPEHSRGVVITGKDAGVAAAFAGYEKDGLVPVDPLDPDDMSRVLEAALAKQLHGISGRLVTAVRANDARGWATRFLTAMEEFAC